MTDGSMGRSVPHSEGREALVTETLRQMRVSGPATVQPKEVCDDLGLSKSLVNFHFGGRDGLLAEAMVLGYEEYVAVLEAAVAAAGDDPDDRLNTWIDTQIEWTAANPGLAAALNFMREASSMRSPMPEALVARLTAAGARNFSNVRRLVRAAWVARHPGESIDNYAVGVDAALIGWTTLGASVWTAGQHLPTAELGAPHIARVRARFRAVVAAMLAE